MLKHINIKTPLEKKKNPSLDFLSSRAQLIYGFKGGKISAGKMHEARVTFGYCTFHYILLTSKCITM
jgi:hypothetical protein